MGKKAGLNMTKYIVAIVRSQIRYNRGTETAIAELIRLITKDKKFAVKAITPIDFAKSTEWVA